MNEAELQRTVFDAARLGGWVVAHFRPALNSRGQWRTPVAADGAGFPDVVLVRDRIIFAELKGDGGRVSVEQSEWLRRLTVAGADARLVRPAHLDGLVAELVARPPRRPRP